jgi:S-adenosylmethionine:tRNA-ribosyltransferase-isomerase (queuine synthetase)
MKLSQFKFEIPEELIASHPTDNREDRRAQLNTEILKISLTILMKGIHFFSTIPKFFQLD